uniref:tRNA methyltransferase 5 n=1 Tax=Hucho hucho TaxID=62062 RepID=A0A4W5RA54_9TELE
MQRVVAVEGSDNDRLLLLDHASVSSPNSFSNIEALRSFGVPQELQRNKLWLTYDNLKSEVVLHAVADSFCFTGMMLSTLANPFPGQVNTIDFTYRFFKMEVMFDFSCVYWNPRLSTKHERVVALLKRSDPVLDVFAGVGPFVIPAARRGCTELANDLKPESHRWLQHNCKLNKEEHKVATFNLDGRAFIQGPLKQKLPALLKGTGSVHNNRQRDMVERASASLGLSLEGQCSVHLVSNVAPIKEIMCDLHHPQRGALQQPPSIAVYGSLHNVEQGGDLSP